MKDNRDWRLFIAIIIISAIALYIIVSHALIYNY